MYAFGSIILARFPFTDLSGYKRRPALVVSDHNDQRSDLIVCFITSVQRLGTDIASIDPAPGTGLKITSVVRFDKIATLGTGVITGKLGDAPAEWLITQRSRFFGVFGFGQPTS